RGLTASRARIKIGHCRFSPASEVSFSRQLAEGSRVLRADRSPARVRHRACFLGMALAAMLLAEPSRGSAAPPAGARLTYEHDVLPLVRKYCWACHGAARKGGLDLRTLQGAVKGGEGGEPAVVAGKAKESPLFELISSGQMPPKGKPRPTPAELATIGKWI